MSGALLQEREASRDALPVCLWLENSHRLVSLWDMMNIFKVGEVCELLRNMEKLSTTLEAMRLTVHGLRLQVQIDNNVVSPFIEHMKGVVLPYLEQAERACELGHLSDALVRIQVIRGELSKEIPADLSIYSVEMRHAVEEIVRDLSSRSFLSVDPSRSLLVDNRDIMGSEVAHSFPSAVPDIIETGNCLAAECNTAAVFHMMRAVEWGLRALAVNLGITKIRVSRKPGKRKRAPLSYSEWEKILDSLQDAVDAKMAKLQRGSSKQKLQEFYYPALQDIRGIRDAWRNHVMHTRAEYTHENALAIFSYVKRFLLVLSKRISEVS